MSLLTRDYSVQARAASGINILLGIWLLLSPWVFDYSERATVVNSVVVGALIALFGAIRLASLQNSIGLSGVNLVLALWTIASPWVLDYAANVGAIKNSLILGILVGVLALWSLCATIAGERHPPGAPAH
ncbi:MAG: SPW repeat protein [Steroidobacteraceae bacterium]|jgi:hypothetical protein